MADQVKIFGERLKKVLEGLNTMKNYGLDEEILIAWLIVKTKLSKKDVCLMLRSQEEFYNKLISQSILEQFKKDGNSI